MYKINRRKVVIILLSSLFFVNCLASNAGWGTESTTYNPPLGKERQQYRRAGASRGCTKQLEDAVVLLTPEDHIGLTVSANPTIFWYVKKKISVPIEFTLLEPKHKPLFVKKIKATSPGIVALKLPPEVAKLEIGKQYRWTISLICNPYRPSDNSYASAWIERIPFSTSLKIETSQNKANCSLIYGKASIWYDALGCTFSE